MTPTEQQISRWDREAYEQRSLRETERVLETWKAPHRKQVREVRLEGSYPETAIAVRYWNPHREEEHTERYALWPSSGNSPFAGGYQGNLESPDAIGVLISTWVMGG